MLCKYWLVKFTSDEATSQKTNFGVNSVLKVRMESSLTFDLKNVRYLEKIDIL